ncbi:Cro/C1-type HTH DNA-binding domain-containing protein [Sulfitobacter delicatus]|uniref:Cro/C1-type HTH DNA-binding domain-containing protein n=2 Tax=Sulfitobacter delicatus TaxID=218672 RepID=A0A1G7KKR7_9RHOB|nr:Cro/C1-type HTH DNA-binding domain-containing protein [Sulfitobacter delicatus]
MVAPTRSPAELRSMFGANLRELSTRYDSISELSRRLGINRTQFNRYLAGESFPRPDVLARICRFFEVDARVLLEPVEQIKIGHDPFNNGYLRDFLGTGIRDVPETDFPSGFYRFARRSFLDGDRFVTGLVHVSRRQNNTFLRGFESAKSLRLQGLPTNPAVREYRGLISRQENGVSIVVSRRKALTGSFNYLTRVASFENNFWVGYVTRTAPESSTGTRVTRLTYEYIGRDPRAVLPAARAAGFTEFEDISPFHRRLLQPDVPFT